MKSIDRSKTVERVNVALRVAFYARVSTEDQAERATIMTQIEYLHRKFAADFDPDSPQPMQFVGDFKDEGYSGTLPLADRPDGKRLLDAIRAGEVDLVIVYRLDRLGRKIRVLLDAHEAFESAGVALMSATEPFDTRTAIGRFVFQLLGSIAELETNTIRERMVGGRDRVAREGRFINGPIPYGYDLDLKADRLVLSERLVPVLNITESEVAREILVRVSKGESCAAVARWLNTMGVPATTRHRKGDAPVRDTRCGKWRRDRIAEMVHTSTYAGTRLFDHKAGEITQSVPMIVDEVTLKKAEVALQHVVRAPRWREDIYTYLLRGKLVCGLCESALQGNIKKGYNTPDGTRLYYVCGRAPGKQNKGGTDQTTCHLGGVVGEALEETVLSELDEFFANPQAALDELREQLRTRQGDSVDHETVMRRLHSRLRDGEAARRDIVALMRDRTITRAEAEVQLNDIASEAAQIRRDLENLDNHQQVTNALETQLVDTAAMLTTIGQEWGHWRRANDRDHLREVIQQLVIRIVAYPGQKSQRIYAMASPESTVEGGSTTQPTTIDPNLMITRGVAA